MICNQCGATNEESSKFCNKCGNQIQAPLEVNDLKQPDIKTAKFKSIFGMPIKYVALISVVAVITFVYWTGNSKNKWVMYDSAYSSVGDAYYDKTSIRSTENGVKVWTMHQIIHISNGVKSWKAYEEIDCNVRRFRFIKKELMSGLLGQGKVLDSRYGGEWEEFSPDSSYDKLWVSVCAK